MATTGLAQAVGHIPSGLFIIGSKHQDDDGIDGFLASWVQQVSFSPLLVSICLKEGRPAYDAIINGDAFAINIVGDDTSFLKHFWSGYDPEKRVFDNIEYEIVEGNAVVMKQAKSSIVCKKVSSSKPGDHVVVIAEVIASIVHDDKSKPQVHIRKTGLDY